MENEGRKDDQGKLRYDLIPAYPMMRLAEVYTIGANRYGDDNYLKGMKWRRIIGAMFRHIWAWIAGEVWDPKDGQHHLASAAWCCLTLIEYENRQIGEDDRVVITNKEVPF